MLMGTFHKINNSGVTGDWVFRGESCHYVEISNCIGKIMVPDFYAEHKIGIWRCVHNGR